MLRSVAIIVGVMAVAGWPSLSMPFRGDEALFMVVARELSAGAVLYRDLWDITNPGVFWFYQIAGTLFGFSEEGVRLFEWVWTTAFVLVVSEASRRDNGLTRLPLAPAVFVGVTYYLAGYSGTAVLTKTEGLVGFPMFVAAWCASRATNPAARATPWLVTAGAAGGIVVLFKLLFAGCLALLWVYLLVVWVRRRGVGLQSVVGYGVGLGAGLLIVLTPAVGYFAAHGAAGVLVQTVIEMPPRFLAEGQRADLDRLAESVRWFLGAYTHVMVLAVPAVSCRLRAAASTLVWAMLILLASAFAAILVQRLSWWPYHFLFPGTLAGALAAYGWPAVVQAARDRTGRPFAGWERATAATAAVVLFLPALGAGGYQYLRLAGHEMGVRAAGRRALREGTGSAYRVARAEVAWLAEPDAKSGPIFVCGDPLFYWLSDRKPAVRISGWSLEIYPAEVRVALAEEVRIGRPVYIYVSTRPHGYEALIRERYPDLSRLLTQDYRPTRPTALGVWYTLRTDPPE